MNWLAEIGDSCVYTVTWLTVLMGAFGVLVLLMPCNRGMAWWRDLRGFATDLLYWFVTPLFVRVVRTALLAAGLALLAGDEPTGFSCVRDLSIWLQCVLIVLVQDVILYWLHRAFHSPVGWRFHAVHHSPKVLDWLAASRFHV